PSAPSAPPLAFDEALLLQRMEGDHDFAREIGSIYLERTPATMLALREALAASDARAIRNAAHALKGTTLSVAASPASDIAAALERAGATGDLSAAAVHLASLEPAYAAYTAGLRAFVEREEQASASRGDPAPTDDGSWEAA